MLSPGRPRLLSTRSPLHLAGFPLSGAVEGRPWAYFFNRLFHSAPNALKIHNCGMEAIRENPSCIGFLNDGRSEPRGASVNELKIRARIESSPIMEHEAFAAQWYSDRADDFVKIRQSSIRFGETQDVTEKEFWKSARADGRVRTFPGFATMLSNQEKEPWNEERDGVLRLVDYVDRRRNDFSHEGCASFAGLSAAHILGLPTLASHSEKVDRQVPPPRSSFTGVFSRTRRAIVEPVTIKVAGLPVSSIPQTVVDLARWEGPMDGLIAGDFMLHEGLGTTAQVADIVGRLPRVAGIHNARLVLALMDSRVESPGESLTRWRFYEAGIAGLEPQVRVQTPSGGFRMDLFDASRGVDIEFDGVEKIANPLMRGGKSFGETMADEARRQRELRHVGIQVYRLEWKDVITKESFERWLMRMRRYGLPY